MSSQASSGNKTSTPATNKRRSAAEKSKSKQIKFSPLEEDKTAKPKNFAEQFSLEKYMKQRGYAKFEHTKTDLYRFLDAFETGCGKMKYDDRQKMSSLLFFLGPEEEMEYLNIRNQQSPADWEELKQMFTDFYHTTVYDRTFGYLVGTCTGGSVHKFAQKKVEVLRNFLKTVTDCDMIQIISWALPESFQRHVMPKMFFKIDSFLKAIKEYEEQIENEEEEQSINSNVGDEQDDEEISNNLANA